MSACLCTLRENEARPRSAFIGCALFYDYRWRIGFLEQKKQSNEWFNSFMLKTVRHNWTQNSDFIADFKNRTHLTAVFMLTGTQHFVYVSLAGVGLS